MEPENQRAAGPNWPTLISTISTVLAPISIVTALLVFSAWTRTKAYFQFFGVDPRILSLTAQDYLLRSADTAFGVLVWVAAGSIITLVVFQLGDRILKKLAEPRRKRIGAVIAWSALAVVLFGLSVAVSPFVDTINSYVVCAILLGASLVLLHARTCLGFEKKSPNDRLILAIVIVIISAASFWATTNYATDLGTREAEYVDGHPGEQAEVDLFSGQPLDIPGDLVAPSLSSLTPSKSSYRYVGLRLLEYSNSRWLLLTGHRPSLHASVLIIKDSDDVHVEITQPPQRY